MKNIEVKVHVSKLDIFIIGIIGSIKTISTSKIKKIIVIKKNRKENGNREDLLGSNPHSKGEFFSRSENDFFDKIVANLIIIQGIIKIIIDKFINKKIIYINFFLNFLIGS